MKLNERLKECRKNKKLTQEQLAKMVNINRSTYAKYETGENEPDAAMLDILANFFEVSVDYLLGRTNKPSNDNNIPEDVEFILRAEEEMSPEAYRAFIDFVKRAKQNWESK